MSSNGDSRTTGDVAVYRKSDRGMDQLVATHSRALSGRERQLLILLDGRRTVGELSQLFGPETIWSLTTGLEEKGFAERVEAAPSGRRDHRKSRVDVGVPGGAATASDHRWSRDWFALVNLGMLAIVVAMAASLVVLGLRRPDSKPPFGAASSGPWSGDARGLPGPVYDGDSGNLEGNAVVSPLSRVLSGADRSGSRPALDERSRRDRVNAR